MTASAHIITAVIGSGVLSLSWAIAQLGWIAGPITLLIFSGITWFTSTLLADCCRDPVTGRRCRCYMDAVKSNLGNHKICRLIIFEPFLLLFCLVQCFPHSLHHLFTTTGCLVEKDLNPKFTIHIHFNGFVQIFTISV